MVNIISSCFKLQKNTKTTLFWDMAVLAQACCSALKDEPCPEQTAPLRRTRQQRASSWANWHGNNEPCPERTAPLWRTRQQRASSWANCSTLKDTATTSLVLSKLLRSEGQGNNEPCLEWTGKSSMDWNLLLLINKKQQLASAKMKTETLPWQPATTAAVSNIHWQLSCNISWTLNSALTWAQHLHWESEWVGFNVPINTLQVISETSLSSQSLALVLTT